MPVSYKDVRGVLPRPIRIVVDGRPQPWARTMGGKTRALFTPTHVRSYQHVLKMFAQVEMAGRPPLDGPLNLAVRAFLKIPTGWSKVKTAAALDGTVRPITRPDLGNYVKLVEDALNQIVWADDSQIVGYEGSGKWYSDKPRLEVEVAGV